jgi:hypothetical protein
MIYLVARITFMMLDWTSFKLSFETYLPCVIYWKGLVEMT